MTVTVYRHNYSFCIEQCVHPESCTSCYRATPIWRGNYLGTSGDNILVAHRDSGNIEKVPFYLCQIKED